MIMVLMLDGRMVMRQESHFLRMIKAPFFNLVRDITLLTDKQAVKILDME